MAGRGRGHGQLLHQSHGRIGVNKRGLACCHLVKNDAERIQVSPKVNRQTLSLFRGHISHGAQSHALLGQLTGEIGLSNQAKIH